MGHVRVALPSPHEAPLEPEHPAGPSARERHRQAGERLHRLHQVRARSPRRRSPSRPRPSADEAPRVMQGVVKAYDPVTRRRRRHVRHRPRRLRPQQRPPSRARCCACSARGSASIFDLDDAGRATGLRLGLRGRHADPRRAMTRVRGVTRPAPVGATSAGTHIGGEHTMSGTTGNEQLKQWVDHWAGVLQPADIYWCDGSAEEYEQPVRAARRQRHVHDARPGQAAQQLLGPLRPGRRRPRRGPHVHLLRPPSGTPAPTTTGASPTRCAPRCSRSTPAR